MWEDEQVVNLVLYKCKMKKYPKTPPPNDSPGGYWYAAHSQPHITRRGAAVHGAGTKPTRYNSKRVASLCCSGWVLQGSKRYYHLPTLDKARSAQTRMTEAPRRAADDGGHGVPAPCRRRTGRRREGPTERATSNKRGNRFAQKSGLQLALPLQTAPTNAPAYIAVTASTNTERRIETTCPLETTVGGSRGAAVRGVVWSACYNTMTGVSCRLLAWRAITEP